MTPNAISSCPFPKRRKFQQSPPLLPGLPDHISQLCLSRVNDHLTLNSVCHSWRRLIHSPSFPPFLSVYALLLPTAGNPDTDNSLRFSCFDPVSSKWVSVPSPPPPLRLLIRHPSFLSRNLPVQSVSVSGKLVLLAATTDHLLPALPRPLIFDPLSQSWSIGPPLENPRRWCAAGAVENSVVVASGIGSHYNQDVAKSVEIWDVLKHHDLASRHGVGNWRRNRNSTASSCGSCNSGWDNCWQKAGPMRDVKFSREAIEAVGWRGKLCMVNVKGSYAKEGVIYNLKTDEWNEMQDGMLAGWRGPAASMGEETIYVVDEARGVLRKYEPEIDGWKDVFESEKLKGAEHIAASGGRVCVVCSGGVEIVVVDVVASPPRLRVVEMPAGFEAVAIHLLPRMSHPDMESPAISTE